VTKEEIVKVIFFYLFSSVLILLNVSFICFLSLILFGGSIFINPDWRGFTVYKDYILFYYGRVKENPLYYLNVQWKLLYDPTGMYKRSIL
jgi:hypothetical protein